MANVSTSDARRAAAAPAASVRRPKALLPRAQRNAGAWAFLIGAVLCFSFFSWYPIVREVIMSFQKPVYGGGFAWTGWTNYIRIFHDPTFWQAWRNTAEFTLLALIIGFAVPFVVAIVLNELRHARGYLRALVYLPVMLPPASALLLFAYFYNPQYGLFDDILRILHLPQSQWVLTPGTGFISAAMVSVVIASTWMNMGAATLIYLAALQNIPGELYEAAELEGAGILRRVRHVTIPQTRLILILLLMLQVVATMQMFIESYVLTNGGGGVGDNVQSVVMLIYQYAFALSGASNYNSASPLGTRRGSHAGARRLLRRVPVGHPRARLGGTAHGFTGHRRRHGPGVPAPAGDRDPVADIPGFAEPPPWQDHLPRRADPDDRGVHARVHRADVLPVRRRAQVDAGNDRDTAHALSASVEPRELRGRVEPARCRADAVEHRLLRGRRAGVPARLRRGRRVLAVQAPARARERGAVPHAGHADDPGHRARGTAVPDGGQPSVLPLEPDRLAGRHLAAFGGQRVQ